MNKLPPDIPSGIGSPTLTDFFRRLIQWTDLSLKSKIPFDEATDGVYLISSPGGKVYKITVTDAGALVTTLVPLGSHP